jgi:VPDSG-CTERM motif
LGIIKAWASIDLFAPARLPYGLVYIARLPPGTVWGILRVLDSGFVDVARRPSLSFAPGRIICQKSGRGSSEFLTNVCYYLQAAILQADVRSSKLACLVLFLRDMKSSFTLLLVLTAATIFSLAQPVKAGHVVQGGPTYVTVPDGGSTMSLLGLALLGVAALRSKLGR